MVATNHRAMTDQRWAAEKVAMLRSGNTRHTAGFTVCVGVTGTVTSLEVTRRSGYSDWDAKLLAALRGWRYRPYQIGGRAVPVCGTVTFNYEIR